MNNLIRNVSRQFIIYLTILVLSLTRRFTLYKVKSLVWTKPQNRDYGETQTLIHSRSYPKNSVKLVRKPDSDYGKGDEVLRSVSISPSEFIVTLKGTGYKSTTDSDFYIGARIDLYYIIYYNSIVLRVKPVRSLS